MGTEFLAISDNARKLSGVSGREDSHMKQLTTEALFESANEILILHAGDQYLLTITKQRKLLLTKVKHRFK
jgi:hemin uptake protein HemP